MLKMTEHLYYGNIQPLGRNYASDSPFARASRLTGRTLEKLTQTFNAEQKELFDKFCDAQSEMDEIVKYDTFSYAFKLGMLLTAETFTGQNEIVREDD